MPAIPRPSLRHRNGECSPAAPALDSAAAIRRSSKAARQAPDLLSAVSSASSMWVANAATVSPSADSLDGQVHLTVANLNDKFHRQRSANDRALLRAIFPMSSALLSILLYRRWRCLAMKGRRTITASAASI